MSKKLEKLISEAIETMNKNEDYSVLIIGVDQKEQYDFTMANGSKLAMAEAMARATLTSPDFHDIMRQAVLIISEAQTDSSCGRPC